MSVSRTDDALRTVPGPTTQAPQLPLFMGWLLALVFYFIQLLVLPDLEAGNMLAKSLSLLAGADAAGTVLGARVPIILTSRADSVVARLASRAVAAVVALARRDPSRAMAS